MNKRRFGIIAAVLVLVTSATAGALAFFHFREPNAVRVFHKIEMDMTLAEVTTIIGCPPGTYYSAAEFYPCRPTVRSGVGFGTAIRST